MRNFRFRSAVCAALLGAFVLAGCATNPYHCTNVPGAVVGGIAGGVIGSELGRGSGIATGAGAATGAVIGSTVGC